MAAALKEPAFGGASVTIPHKQNVLPYLDSVSAAAETIGAVNTVIVSVNPDTGAKVSLECFRCCIGICTLCAVCNAEVGCTWTALVLLRAAEAFGASDTVTVSISPVFASSGIDVLIMVSSLCASTCTTA